MLFLEPGRRGPVMIIGFLIISLLLSTVCLAQNPDQPSQASPSQPSILKTETVPVKGGAELVTIYGRVSGLFEEGEDKWVPMVSVLRDTLGDFSPENDRLRYVWPLTYTRPTVRQRLSGAIPFLYVRVGNKESAQGKTPPPAIDLATPDRDVWDRIFWTALQNILLDPYGTPIKATSRSYRRNQSDYRKSHVIRALSVLALYQSMGGPPVFSDAEMAEIQARLQLADKTLGGILDDLKLYSYYQKQIRVSRDERGHNWELLRQQAEAESLYFEPLQMPDGSVTHALLWIAKNELTQPHRYSGRFLNISDPWKDSRLRDWQGFVETRYFDSESRMVSRDTPGAQPRELIPLALYGLDNPKIPMLLIDFRDTLNPKKREMSRRVLQDVTGNILSVSQFGNLSYFLGRTVLDFVTGKRGIDFNQPSRLQTYSQLKLLLALDESLDPRLRRELSNRLETVSLNPLENDLEIEARIAQEQYQALLAYAQRPDGLPAKLNRDRRAEMVPLEHGTAARAMFRLANIVSFGKYTHREEATPSMEDRLDVARRVEYHTRFLQQVANSAEQVDVAWDLEEVKYSLRFIAEHSAIVKPKAVIAAATIFTHTEDSETKRICLESLSRINNPKARDELLRISEAKDLEQEWKDLIVAALNNPQPQEQPLAAAKPKSGSSVHIPSERQ